MKKIKFRLSIGYRDAVQEDVFEFDDDITEEELEDELKEWANNYIELSLEELR